MSTPVYVVLLQIVFCLETMRVLQSGSPRESLMVCQVPCLFQLDACSASWFSIVLFRFALCDFTYDGFVGH